MKDPAVIEQFAKTDIIPVVQHARRSSRRSSTRKPTRWAAVVKKLDLKVD